MNSLFGPIQILLKSSSNFLSFFPLFGPETFLNALCILKQLLSIGPKTLSLLQFLLSPALGFLKLMKDLVEIPVLMFN